MKKLKRNKKYSPEFPPPMEWLKWIILGYLGIFLWVILLTYFMGK